jgi:hypothetical protein
LEINIMAAPTFTKNKFGATDQTQAYFRIRGLLGLAGLYTNATGIPFSFIGLLNASGAPVRIPPTYTGSDGPGQAVPVPPSQIQSTGGYTLFYDSMNASIRIFNGTTEVSTGAIPAALLATVAAINVSGTGYATNDTVSVAGETGMVIQVTAQSGGVPSAIAITVQGAAVAATAAATTAITGTGSGLTVNITVNAGIPALFEFLRG